MVPGRYRAILACIGALLLIGAINSASAYSIYPETREGSISTSTRDHDAVPGHEESNAEGALRSGFDGITAPVRNFWDSVQTVRPGDLVRMQSPQLPQTVSQLNTWVDGWIKSVVDWFKGLVS